MKASKTKIGRKIMCHDGKNPYHKNMSNKRQKEIPRSTRLVMTELAGMIILGKYTLVIRFALPINELLDSLNALLKNCHGSIPANTINA